MGHRDRLELGIDYMTTEPNEFSFLPEDFRDRSARHRLTAAAIAIAAIVAIATGNALYVAERSLQHVKRHNAEVTQAFNQAVLRGEQAAAVRNENEQLIERARRIAVMAAGIPSSKILAELTGALPPSMSLTSLSIQSVPHAQAMSVAPTAYDLKKAALESSRRAGADPLPDVAPSDVVVKLSGDADTNAAISQFCESLSRSSLFRDVRMVASEICAATGNSKTATRRFQIEAMFNPPADPNRAAIGSSTASVAESDDTRAKEKP
jgi:Tfp pilus assembly protein PilN